MSYELNIFVLFSFAVFSISFVCSGRKAGQVDMTLKLNYTRVQSDRVVTESLKTFNMVVRRDCRKTGTFLLIFFHCVLNFLVQFHCERIQWTPA